MAVERGGNASCRSLRDRHQPQGVKIVGDSSVTRLARPLRRSHARNLYAFVETLIDKTSNRSGQLGTTKLVKADLPDARRRDRASDFQPKAA